MRASNKTFLRLFKKYRHLKHKASLLLAKGDMRLYAKKLLEISALQMQLAVVK